MKKTVFVISIALAVAFALGTGTVQGQMGRGGYGYGMGPGMMGGYGPGYGMGPGMMGGYGNSWMCAHMGGIWCYWPSFGWVIQVLIFVALVLFIVWMVKQLNEARQEPFIRTRSQEFTHSRGKK